MKKHKTFFLFLFVIFIFVIGCQKSETPVSRPGCSVKFTNEQIFDIAQQYLKVNYPNQAIKEVKLTGCEGGESLFEATVYENDAKIAVLLIRGDTGDVNYIGE